MNRLIPAILLLVVLAPSSARSEPATIEVGFGLGNIHRTLTYHEAGGFSQDFESETQVRRLRGKLTIPFTPELAGVFSYVRASQPDGLDTYGAQAGGFEARDHWDLFEFGFRLALWGRK